MALEQMVSIVRPMAKFARAGLNAFRGMALVHQKDQPPSGHFPLFPWDSNRPGFSIS
jgi:hypothetical protein